MDTRSPGAKAMAMVSSIMTIAFMMAIPAFLGYLVDHLLGTVVVFMFLGVVFGVVAGVWQLVKLVQSYENSNAPSGDNQADDEAETGI